jgi:hypothetical protein
MLQHELPRDLIELKNFSPSLQRVASNYAALSDVEVMPRGVNSNEIDHIDPRWEEGRDYQLVCGFEKDPKNLREEDWLRNTAKSNRFLPWRWSHDELGVVPTEPGNLAFFLIGADIETDTAGEWVLMEFLSKEWFAASSHTCGSSAKKQGVPRPDLVEKQWVTLRENPDLLDKRNESIRQTMQEAFEEDPTRLERLKDGHQRHREENPEFWEEMNRQSSDRLKKVREEKSDVFEQAAKEGGKVTGNRKCRCTETGEVLGPGPLTQYQRARGIDPANRVELTPEEIANIKPFTPEELKTKKRIKNQEKYLRLKSKRP